MTYIDFIIQIYTHTHLFFAYDIAHVCIVYWLQVCVQADSDSEHEQESQRRGQSGGAMQISLALYTQEVMLE